MMDMTPTTTTTTTTIQTPKSPEPESETPTRIQPAKPISFSNGIIKRHHHHHHHPLLFTYKECLKNHAAALGGHALDGCGEFMPSPSSISTDPTSLKCAACGCHRNFHRRDPDNDSLIPPLSSTVATAIEYQPHHRHHPPPPPPQQQQQQQGPPSLLPPPRSPNSASPPPISSSYMLLSLSGTNNNNLAFSDLNFSGGNNNNHHHHHNHNPHGSRKRFRTKFSQFQKEKMQEFAERVGWKMQKRDEDDVREFCRQIGVDKSVLKVWMHNNKNTFNRRDLPFSVAGTEIQKTNNGGVNHSPVIAGETNNNNNNGHDAGEEGGGVGHELHHSVSSGGGGFDSDSGGANGGNVNGSSSS